MAGKGNPRLTIRVSPAALWAFEEAAKLAHMEMHEWARSVLEERVGILPGTANAIALPHPAVIHVDEIELMHPDVFEEGMGARRLTQLEQEARELERESPFKK